MRKFASFFVVACVMAWSFCLEKDPLVVPIIDYGRIAAFSLIPPHIQLDIPGTTFKDLAFAGAFITIAPQIGYYGEGYPMRNFKVIIQLPSERIDATVPESVRSVMPLGARTVQYTICILGESVKPETNIVFHPWARTWAESATQVKGDYFSINVPMGIFESDGVRPAPKSGIALGGLRAENVNVHNGTGLAFSPNNARFVVEKNREVSTFWVVAYSPDKKNVCISFIVLMNSVNAEELLAGALSGVGTLGKFVTQVRGLESLFANPQDNAAVARAVQTIEAIISGKRVAPAPPGEWKLVEALDGLTHALDKLTSSF